jgi:1-acyl-sn-glycerol-3-phosphate acyltransferase
LATLIFGLLAIISSALRVRGPVYGGYARGWAKWLLLANGTRVDVEGLEHVAPDRPQLFVSNHVSGSTCSRLRPGCRNARAS